MREKHQSAAHIRVGRGLRLPIQIGAAALLMAAFIAATLYSASGLRDALSESTRAYVQDVNLQLADDITARLEDNEAADALAELVAQQPLTLSLREYGGFDQYAELDLAPYSVQYLRYDVQE